MISFLKHQTDVLALHKSLGITLDIDTQVPLEQAYMRILARDVHAVIPVPPFSNSAMDGFAVLQADLGQGIRSFPVSADVPAGTAPVHVPSRSAVRIMTGAPITEEQRELVSIIPVEDTNIPSGSVALPQEIVVSRVGNKRHIRNQGESCSIGDVVAHLGSVVDAGVVAALVSTGVTMVDIYAAPRVAVVSSGNELRPPGSILAPGEIPDSNTFMMAGLIRSVSPGIVSCHQLGDTPEEFHSELQAIAATVDLIVTTGGVSAGAFDVVKESLSQTTTAEVEFRTVAMQPGKPQGFGKVDDTPIVCLPGNPVSAFVSFHLFVKPLLLSLSGMNTAQTFPKVLLPTDTDLQVSLGRDLFVPCHIDWELQQAQVKIPGGKGSHFVSSLAGVTGMIHLPSDQQSVNTGELVTVYLI